MAEKEKSDYQLFIEAAHTIRELRDKILTTGCINRQMLSADVDALYMLVDGSRAISEVRLTPKGSSSGPEGTVYYDSDDSHLYVGTE